MKDKYKNRYDPNKYRGNRGRIEKNKNSLASKDKANEKTADSDNENAKHSQVSKLNPVPRYRSYGVTKKETLLTRFNDRFADLLGYVLMALCLIILAISSYSVIYMLGAIGIALVAIGVIVFIYIVLLRTCRKRIKFLRRLKKQCKKYKYRLKINRHFLRAFKYREACTDFTVETGRKVWNVSFFTVKKYESSMMFDSTEKLRLVSPPINISNESFSGKVGRRFIVRTNIFSVFSRKKNKCYTISFNKNNSAVNHKTVKYALLVNPVPRSMYKREKDGTVSPIGTGENFGPYIVFSGSGFLETLLRED